MLLARRANWKDPDQKSGIFSKHSTVGGFGPVVYTVSGCQLRQSKSGAGKHYVAVYGLKEMGRELHFYDAELIAVL